MSYVATIIIRFFLWALMSSQISRFEEISIPAVGSSRRTILECPIRLRASERLFLCTFEHLRVMILEHSLRLNFVRISSRVTSMSVIPINLQQNLICSSGVRLSIKASFCRAIDKKLSLVKRNDLKRSTPNAVAVPLRTWVNPAIVCKTTDFPEPFLPMKTKISFCLTVRVRSSTT